MKLLAQIKSFFLKHPAFGWALGILLVLEVVVRVLPMEYSVGAGVFLTNYRRQVAESDGKLADYIILGDSRSLSLNGKARDADAPYSVYNFSLPAMSPRYFPYLLRKIVEHRAPEDRPTAVIFAGDPGLFQSSWIYPYHDKDLRYSSGIHDSLVTYLWNRFYLRLRRLILREAGPPSRPSNALVWDAFSHRFLHLFSMGELAEMFTGAERVFILREALPLQYRTYKWRDGLRQYTFGLRGDYFLPYEFPTGCDTCAALLTERCHPEAPRVQDNRRMRAVLESQHGGFNLANRLNPIERFQYLAMRDRHVNKQVENFNRITPDFYAAEALIEEARRLGLKIVFTDVPSMDVYRGTAYHRKFFEGLEEYRTRYPDTVAIMRFPDPYYPKELFVEQVHYECAGAERLNLEFYADVMPRIVKFAPPAE